MKVNADLTRRAFLRNTAVTAAAVAFPAGVFAGSQNQMKVGLIGCGGRGTDSAVNACSVDSSIVIWSMGDVFEDRLRGSMDTLRNAVGAQFAVTPERGFVGFDAYKKVIDSGVDIVLLVTPPGFRPVHFEAAVAANKHVFMEKPVAVDGPGVRQMLEAARVSEAKGLKVAAGTQRRHDPPYRENLKRIHDGQIGEITALYAYWNQGGLWMHPRQENWSDMEWQLRNWLYFTWISGDHIVEQHVHNIDVCNWAIQKTPVKAISLGGRQVRTDPAFGHVFDHFATEFEYDNGVRMISMCRQIDNTATRVNEHIVGTKGTSAAYGIIRGENPWRFDGERPNPYVEEHKNLIAAIKNGSHLNEARQVTESTLTAIMGRMAAYTGQEVTWDMALNSVESLVPTTFEMGALPVAPVAMPGRTPFT